jgi:hypothetical protein
MWDPAGPLGRQRHSQAAMQLVCAYGKYRIPPRERPILFDADR